MKLRKLLLACLLALIPASYVAAEEDQPARREEKTRRQVTTTVRDTSSDTASQGLVSQLATLLTIRNQEEIELARFASEKSQNEEVKEFAQKLIQDHSQFVEKLEKFNPQAEFALDAQGSTATPTSTRNRGARNPEPDRQPTPDAPNPDADGQDQPERNRGGDDQQNDDQATRRDAAEAEVSVRRTTVAAAGEKSEHNAHLQVAREAARICLEMTKEKLSSKEGKEFDQCFVGGQIMAHVQMVAKLQAMQQVASPEFNELLEQGIQSSQEHMKHAEMLAQKLEGQHGGAERGEAGNRQRTPANEDRDSEEERNDN